MEPREAVKEALWNLRYQRYLTIRDLPDQERDPDGTRHCRWCGKVLEGRRRTWCSSACAEEFQVRFGSNTMRRLVFRRDHGVCSVCGMDTSNIKQDVQRIRRSLFDVFGYFRINWPPYVRAQWGPWWNAMTFWQVDHILPVVAGGGCCGLENLRTLCCTCHHRETADLARRRAVARTEFPEYT